MEKISVKMRISVHPIKAKIWQAMEKNKLKPEMSLRQVGKIIDVDNAQQIKHHLESMRKMGSIGWKDGMYDYKG